MTEDRAALVGLAVIKDQSERCAMLGIGGISANLAEAHETLEAAFTDHAAQLAAKDRLTEFWRVASLADEQRAIAAEQRIRDAVALIRTDSHAATFQSLGQYRKALIDALTEAAP